jgi:glycerol-3-phosphate dehydrogenase
MAETAVRNGAELLLSAEVTSLTRRDNYWRLTTKAGTYDTRYVVNAAGAHSEEVHCIAAPKTFTIKHSRGQYDLLDKNEGGRVKTVIFQCPSELGKGTLVSPTVHGNLLVGPDAEEVPGEDTATTGEGIIKMRETARKSVPNVDLRQTIRDFAGVRAQADTADFVIETAADGFIDAAGICSPGLTAAPAIGEYVTGLLKDNGLELSLKDNYIDTRKRIRFNEMDAAERTELVKRNPAYGRVICRCETVTEGEIIDALRSPIPPVSVGGVKRRCNPGMGRCQGGFCAPKIVELLAKELDIQPEDVPQDNGGSWILSGPTKERNATTGGAANV